MLLTRLEWLLITGLCLLVMLYFGPQIESRLYPVTAHVVIEKHEVVSPTKTRIWVSFKKERDCKFLALSWYLGNRDDRFSRSWLKFEDDDDDSAPTRPPGKQLAGPWIVGVPVDDLLKNSFADARHQCHPLWETRTEFYTAH